MLARSLYLWHQIIGPSCGAEDVLRRMAGEIVALPVGADITEQSIKIRPVSGGFDVQNGVLPGADAVFAYITVPDLRLVMSSEALPDGGKCRRLRVLDSAGAPFRRQGAERFMLRYRLASAIARARDVLVLQITSNAGQPTSGLPPLHPWIEVHNETTRQFVDFAETSAGVLANGDAVRLAAFHPGALANAVTSVGSDAGLSLYLEFTGEIIDIGLIGETLIV